MHTNMMRDIKILIHVQICKHTLLHIIHTHELQIEIPIKSSIVEACCRHVLVKKTTKTKTILLCVLKINFQVENYSSNA